MDTPPLSALAKRLELVRELSGLDRAALSELAGLSRSHVGMILRGVVRNPAATSIQRIAAVTGVSIDWLVSGAGDAPTRDDVVAAIDRARERQAAEGSA